MLICWLSFHFSVDVWSVGCIMAEMVRGSVLFPGTDRILKLNFHPNPPNASFHPVSDVLFISFHTSQKSFIPVGDECSAFRGSSCCHFALFGSSEIFQHLHFFILVNIININVSFVQFRFSNELCRSWNC